MTYPAQGSTPWDDELKAYIDAGDAGGGGGPHASTHADGGTDEVSLDASQITTGTLADARIPAAIARDAEVAATYAPLASPALTGNPTAPTPTAGDNDTSIATTAFVTAAVAAGGGGGGGAFALGTTFSREGAFSTFTGTFRIYSDAAATIDGVRASVGTAPTGSSVIVDVLKNGTSIFATTPANRPTIATGTNTDTSGTPDTVALAAGDYLTVSCTQADSNLVAANLTVQVFLA